VLASISVVIDLPLFMVVSIGLGLASVLCGLLAGLSLM
jgi:hypothetical protein